MDSNQYQVKAAKFAIYPKEKTDEYLVLGLCSEAGEIAGKLKKQIRDGIQLSTDDLIQEVGDVIWYCSQLLHERSVPLGDCMVFNIQKLQSRLERGKLQGSGDHR